MTDWHFAIRDTPEPGPDHALHQAVENRLKSCSDRAAKAQAEFRRAVDELVQAVIEAADDGLPADRIGPFAALTREDVQRILDTGRLF